MFTDNYDSSFCFWIFEKRLTQKNCFIFCKKYGLFNGFNFVNNQEIFYCPTFQTFMASVQGGQILVFHTRSRVVSGSHGEGSFKEPIHKQFYSK